MKKQTRAMAHLVFEAVAKEDVAVSQGRVVVLRQLFDSKNERV